LLTETLLSACHQYEASFSACCQHCERLLLFNYLILSRRFPS